MADRALSTSRRALLGAAASLPVLALPAALRAEPVDPCSARPEPVEGLPFPSTDATEWNRRLARYRSLAARAEAAAETGWFRAANDLYYRECADPAVDRKAAFARLDRAEDLYWRRCTDPTQKAAVALALTPTPDIEALRTKIAVIRTHDLQELACMTRNCFEVLEEDVGRLAASWSVIQAACADRAYQQRCP